MLDVAIGKGLTTTGGGGVINAAEELFLQLQKRNIVINGIKEKRLFIIKRF